MAVFSSATQDIPESAATPRHVAIIMDGNGRWAKKRFMPRFAGHRRGVETVRDAVRYCLKNGIEYLTLFAFSSENWRRPEEEVKLLMQLFVHALKNEVAKLHKNGVRLKIMPTFHPAYLLRDPSKKRTAWEDLKLVMAELERLGIAAPAAPR